MKKNLIIICLILTTVSAIAQNSNLNKTAEQLAVEMTSNISQDVQLTPAQQAQMTQAATLYFDTIRNQSSVEIRKTLYDNFRQTLQTIMTPETYSEWVAIVQARVQEKINATQNNNE